MTINILHTTCSTSEKIQKKSLYPRAVRLQNKQPSHSPHTFAPSPLQYCATEVNSSYTLGEGEACNYCYNGVSLEWLIYFFFITLAISVKMPEQYLLSTYVFL